MTHNCQRGRRFLNSLMNRCSDCSSNLLCSDLTFSEPYKTYQPCHWFCCVFSTSCDLSQLVCSATSARRCKSQNKFFKPFSFFFNLFTHKFYVEILTISVFTELLNQTLKSIIQKQGLEHHKQAPHMLVIQHI